MMGSCAEGEGAMCVACHIVDWMEDPGNVVVPLWSPDGTIPPLFTDFSYDNLGIPKNTEFPLNPDAPVDLGLGPIVGDPAENGKFKVMTLRNIQLTEPYAHNGSSRISRRSPTSITRGMCRERCARTQIGHRLSTPTQSMLKNWATWVSAIRTRMCLWNS